MHRPRAAHRACDLSEVRLITQIRIRVGEVSEVEEVEHVPPQFQSHSLGQLRGLRQAQASQPLRRPPQDVPSQVAELAQAREQCPIRIERILIGVEVTASNVLAVALLE